MPVLKIKEDGEWKKVSNVNVLSVGGSGGGSGSGVDDYSTVISKIQRITTYEE